MCDAQELPSQDARLIPGNCHKCGLPLSTNPHPEAGKPSHYLQVGCQKECIPCLVLSRHNWAQQAMTDAGDFRNFHRLLCERFGYVHDEREWRRDQLSLIEWIAASTGASNA